MEDIEDTMSRMDKCVDYMVHTWKLKPLSVMQMAQHASSKPRDDWTGFVRWVASVVMIDGSYTATLEKVQKAVSACHWTPHSQEEKVQLANGTLPKRLRTDIELMLNERGAFPSPPADVAPSDYPRDLVASAALSAECDLGDVVAVADVVDVLDRQMGDKSPRLTSRESSIWTQYVCHVLAKETGVPLGFYSKHQPGREGVTIRRSLCNGRVTKEWKKRIAKIVEDEKSSLQDNSQPMKKQSLADLDRAIQEEAAELEERALVEVPVATLDGFIRLIAGSSIKAGDNLAFVDGQAEPRADGVFGVAVTDAKMGDYVLVKTVVDKNIEDVLTPEQLARDSMLADEYAADIAPQALPLPKRAGLSEADLALKLTGVSATECSAIWDLYHPDEPRHNPYLSAYSVWRNKVEGYDYFKPSEASDMGLLLETAVLYLYLEWLGGDMTGVTYAPGTLRDPNLPWRLASPDVIVRRTLADLKTTGVKWDSVPENYIDQLHWQYGVLTALDWYLLTTMHLPVLSASWGFKFKVEVVEFNPARLQELTENVARFWRDHVEAKVAPPILEDPDETAKAYPVARTSGYVEAAWKDRETLEKYREWLMRLDSCHIAIDKLKARLQARIKTAPGMDFGDHAVSWKSPKDKVLTAWENLARHLGASVAQIEEYTSTKPAERKWLVGKRRLIDDG